MTHASPSETLGRDIADASPENGLWPHLLVAATKFDRKNRGPLPARFARGPVGLCCGVRCPQPDLARSVGA